MKLDNQIQIGHNVRVGAHTAIAGCVGIAGSTRIGERCMIGGQAGIIGHLEIANDVIVSAGTLVTKPIAKKGVYTGNLPVQGHAEWVKTSPICAIWMRWQIKYARLEHRLAGRRNREQKSRSMRSLNTFPPPLSSVPAGGSGT